MNEHPETPAQDEPPEREPALRVPPPPTSPVPSPVVIPEPGEPATPVGPEPNLPEPSEPPTVPPGTEPSPGGPQRPRDLKPWEERPAAVVEAPAGRLAAQSRRDFLLFTAGVAATGVGAWWLLPERTKARMLAGGGHHRLDTIAARVGLGPESRERVLDRALTFDDDVAEALFSKNRLVRTYSRSQVTPLRSNLAGRIPGPEYLPGWTLEVSGLATGGPVRLALPQVVGQFPFREQVTRLVCVEGWSAVAWWGGLRFADFLAAFPPAPGSRWAALRSDVSLDGAGRPDPYYVSIDLETARHPQTLLATHLGGRPLETAHGAPLRLLVPMKLGLKNIKAITQIAYTADEPPDYWNERGYSKYDGL